MNKVCEICGKEFESKRKDARYCSSTCRSQAKRDATDNFATDNFATDNRVSATEHPDRDDIYSEHYDTSEEGYIRRNKDWGKFGEKFKQGVREGSAELNKRLLAFRESNIRRRQELVEKNAIA